MEAAAIKLTRQATFSDEQGRTEDLGLYMVYIVNRADPVCRDVYIHGR